MKNSFEMNIIVRGLNKIIRTSGYKLTKIKRVDRIPQQIFSIGMYEGKSPLTLHPNNNAVNPVITCNHITDITATFVADPFMIKVDTTWYMFFEVMNKRRNRGEIGLAISTDLVNWKYEQVVLVEPFHLSYPYVFMWNGDYYMVPETHEVKTIRLYRARSFPYQWEFIETLISGAIFSDASPFYFKNNWWLFSETNPGYKFDTLRLFYSKNLFGGWQEHPLSPIVDGDPRFARPAGRVIVHEELLLRFWQNCAKVYGENVGFATVSEMTERKYTEIIEAKQPILAGSGNGWNAGGMHHVDLHYSDETKMWNACVDGWYMQR
jgi:hypothetical protein